MDMTDKLKEQIQAQPIITTGITKSKDGKCIIITTKIVKIYAKAYFDKVLAEEKK